MRIPDLNLKSVVHHGTILRQRVAGQDELLGADVILVHRLLKNDVTASTGIEAYALFSQQCVDALDVDVSALGMRASSETYEHIGTVTVWVHDLGRRWQEEESRTRVIVDERQAVYRFDTPTSASPEVAWEFEPTPGGTILHQRFAAPKKPKERAIMEQIASWTSYDAPTATWWSAASDGLARRANRYRRTKPMPKERCHERPCVRTI